MSQRALSAAVMLGVVALALLLFGCGQQRSAVEGHSQPARGRPKAPAGVEKIDVGKAGIHLMGNIDYEQDLGTPPAGGPHNDCGRTADSTMSPSVRRTPSTPWSMGGLDHLPPRPPSGADREVK